MDDAMQTLAQRAVKCKAWRWMPGMLIKGTAWPKVRREVYSDGVARLLRVVDHGDCIEYEWATRWDFGDGGRLPDDAAPDLSDPATLGCLLHLVRAAWGENTGLAIDDDEGWWSVSTQNSDGPCFVGDAREQVLVAALEAAP